MEKYIDLSGWCRGAALMKTDLSLSVQLVFFIRLCLQQGVGWGCVHVRRAPPLSGPCSPPDAVNKAQGAALAPVLCSVLRR